MKNEFERSRHRLLEESVPVKAKIPDGGQKKGLHPEGSNNIHKSTITATASMPTRWIFTQMQTISLMM